MELSVKINSYQIKPERTMEINLLDYHMSMGKQKVVMYYKGPFDEAILAKISHYLKNKFTEHPKAGRKLFAIFIELAQNIAFYSTEKSLFDDEDKVHGIGTIVIQENEEVISFTAGNLVDKATVQSLIEKCEQINQLNEEGLRQLKRAVRSMPRKDGHTGGNIGLIQVALKSGSPLYAEAKEVDANNDFFLITTEIKKKVIVKRED